MKTIRCQMEMLELKIIVTDFLKKLLVVVLVDLTQLERGSVNLKIGQ